MTKINIGNITLKAEVAITESEKQIGLMFRKSLPEAMIFPFKQSEVRQFWMKNTYQPLDIIFANAGQVVAIEAGSPHSLRRLGPEIPVDLIIEIPRGMSQVIGIEVGQKIKIEYSTEVLSKKFAEELRL